MTAQLHQLDRANVDLRNKLTNSFAAFQQLAAENARLREQLQRATVVVPTSAPPPVPLRPPAVVSTNPAASGTASTSPAHGTSNPPSVATAPRTYTIQAGDRLAGIARRYRTTVDELQRLNPTLNVNRIKPNQVIRIP